MHYTRLLPPRCLSLPPPSPPIQARPPDRNRFPSLPTPHPQGLKNSTGYEPKEVFRKYMWYVLNERKFSQEAVEDLLVLKVRGARHGVQGGESRGAEGEGCSGRGR